MSLVFSLCDLLMCKYKSGLYCRWRQWGLAWRPSCDSCQHLSKQSGCPAAFNSAKGCVSVTATLNDVSFFLKHECSWVCKGVPHSPEWASAFCQKGGDFSLNLDPLTHTCISRSVKQTSGTIPICFFFFLCCCCFQDSAGDTEGLFLEQPCPCFMLHLLFMIRPICQW